MKLLRSMMVAAVLALGGLSTVACSSTDPLTTVATTTVDTTDYAKAAYTARATYAGALVLATFYAELPRCGTPGAGKVCSSRPVLDAMLDAERAANAATKAAETAARTLKNNPTAVRAAVVAAQSAVDAFKVIAETYSGKKAT